MRIYSAKKSVRKIALIANVINNYSYEENQIINVSHHPTCYDVDDDDCFHRIDEIELDQYNNSDVKGGGEQFIQC